MIKNDRIFKEIDGISGDKIVLLKWDGESPKFRNLIRVNADGEQIWTVTPSHPLEGVYTELKYDGLNIIAYNMVSGYLETIDYANGHVMFRKFVK